MSARQNNKKKAKRFFQLACKAKDEKGFLQLSRFHLRHDQPRLAHNILVKSCTRGYPRSCFWLGWLSQQKKLPKSSYKAAISYYKRACKQKETGSCNNLAVLYARGEGIRKSRYRAKRLLTKACSGRFPIACVNKRQLRSPEKMLFDRGFEHLNLQSTCLLGQTKDCYTLAKRYHKGEGIKKNFKQARIYYQKACAAQYAKACFTLGTLYDAGLGGKQSYSKAAAHFSQGCKLEHPKTCHKAGQIFELGLGVKRDYAKAQRLFKKACDLKVQSSCRRLVLFQQ